MSEPSPRDGIAMAQLMSPELARNPQPMYVTLRESSPVMRVDGVGTIVTSRSGVDHVLRAPELFSSNMSAHDLKTARPLIPLQIDPPAHRTYRKILDPLFAPQRMKALEEPVAGLVNDLIDTFVDDDEIDFAKQFSVPFPSQVFLTMFGLPLDELPTFLRMKDGVIRPDHVVGHEFGHPDTEAYQQQIADSIYAYFERVLDEREGDGERRDDLLTRLLHAEVDGDRLTREDILDICFLLLIAGLDTVSASLDCFFGRLAQDPAARRAIVDAPQAIPSAVEELLRWETPVMAVARVATRTAELDGCPIGAGEHVMAVIGAANVDDEEFPDAGELRLDRETNRHLAFGGGIHRCLGSHLARLELRVALREWHRRIPDYSVKPGAELNYTAGIRTLDSFPMVLGTRRLKHEQIFGRSC
jgi:cytochrome P450